MGERLSLLSQILLHSYLFGDGMQGQQPGDSATWVLSRPRAHFCKGVVFTAVSGTFGFHTVRLPYVSSE